MREAFPGYYRPTASEFVTLWKSARFAVDANVLLKLYGYSSATRRKLLRLLAVIGDRLWMPHQFASEFQRNRIKAILEQVDSYKSVAHKFKTVLDQQLIPKHRHPFITRKSMAALETIRSELDKGRKQHEKLLSDDPIFEEITNLFGDRIGKASTSEELGPVNTTVE